MPRGHSQHAQLSRLKINYSLWLETNPRPHYTPRVPRKAHCYASRLSPTARILSSPTPFNVYKAGNTLDILLHGPSSRAASGKESTGRGDLKDWGITFWAPATCVNKRGLGLFLTATHWNARIPGAFGSWDPDLSPHVHVPHPHIYTIPRGVGCIQINVSEGSGSPLIE